MDLDLVSFDDLVASRVPPGWFVEAIKHVHTPIIRKGDTHRPNYWRVELQRLPRGGRLVVGVGISLDAALMYAVDRSREVDKEFPRGRKDSL